MRRLSANQLKRLRLIAVAMLEAPSGQHSDLGIAPEDLVVACDRALGFDEMADEDLDEKRALVATSHERCAEAWGER